ncbi:MAG TPA: carbohydrate ABC transporter permease [Candidatus Atribacteria bacterium]|nr:carbohydrate ABC transporter permease [Candidatus Atribacteria bacterium]
MVKSNSSGDRMVKIVSYTVVTVLMLSCLLPLIHTLALSLSDKSAAASGMVTLWPVRPSNSAYKAILGDKQFFLSFKNSIVRILLGGALNIFFTVTMAFPLSRSKRLFPQRNIYMWFLIFTMLFSGGIIPMYLLIYRLKLMDSIWALVLPSAVPVYNVILLMNYFRGVPRELDEAARLDGAGPLRTMLQVFVPVSMPCIATITLFSIVGHWNAFFDGAIYINTQAKVPLQTYIQQLVVDMRASSVMSKEELAMLAEISGKSFNAAKVIVTMLPVLLVYPFLQKYFVHGIVLGSVKG